MTPLNPPIRDWNGRTVWLVGASTGIGAATASLLHARGARVLVSARNAPRLRNFVTAHPGAVALPLDVSDPTQIQAAARSALVLGLDSVIYCAGHYQDLQAGHIDLAEMVKHNAINYLGAVYVLEAVLPHLLSPALRGRAHVSLVGSVAGYRGLPRSLAYGPTKAALINLAETLYLELHGQGIGVSLVSPGFVATPLTAGNTFRMPALIAPEEAAVAMLRGWAKGEFEIHFPKRFTLGMKLLQVLPNRIYFALTRRLKQA